MMGGTGVRSRRERRRREPVGRHDERPHGDRASVCWCRLACWRRSRR